MGVALKFHNYGVLQVVIGIPVTFAYLIYIDEFLVDLLKYTQDEAF